MPRPAALFLDLDGTLVDSEPLHIEAHRRFLASQGVAFSVDDLAGNIGKGDIAFYRALVERQQLGAVDVLDWTRRKTQVLMEIYRGEGLPIRPGMAALLDRAFASGVFVAVVTSSDRALCVLSLEVTGLDRRLPMRVCYEDVTHHKPHPQPYLLAAERLSVPPANCVVVEDSESGVRSARAAGCTVIGFAGLVSAERQLAAGAHRCISHGDQVTW